MRITDFYKYVVSVLPSRPFDPAGLTRHRLTKVANTNRRSNTIREIRSKHTSMSEF
jgi:hypothetical protein